MLEDDLEMMTEAVEVRKGKKKLSTYSEPIMNKNTEGISSLPDIDIVSSKNVGDTNIFPTATRQDRCDKQIVDELIVNNGYPQSTGNMVLEGKQPKLVQSTITIFEG